MKRYKEQHSWNLKKARELVEASGYHRWKIAEEVGIAEGTLNNILQGNHIPSVPIIKLLAMVLGCKESELTNGKEQAS